jgi:hypothetical protein
MRFNNSFFYFVLENQHFISQNPIKICSFMKNWWTKSFWGENNVSVGKNQTEGEGSVQLTLY